MVGNDTKKGITYIRISHFKWLIFLYSLDCLLSLKTCLDIYVSIFWHHFWVFPNLIFDYKSSSNSSNQSLGDSIQRWLNNESPFCQFFKISTFSNKEAAILFGGVINFKSQNFGVHILCSLSHIHCLAVLCLVAKRISFFVCWRQFWFSTELSNHNNVWSVRRHGRLRSTKTEPLQKSAWKWEWAAVAAAL